MERKPLEGIESLLFVLGAGAGYALHALGYAWWIVAIAIVVLGIGMGAFVNILRKANKKYNS